LPVPFLTVVLEDLALRPPLLGLCAGYERGSWRHEQFAEYLMQWLIDFALSDDELEDLNTFSARAAMRRAAIEVYETSNYQRRGEFGELLIHAVLRQHFHTLPAIRKVYFKDSPNDTVKGFDAVHVAAIGEELELWLGEAKLYSDLAVAIREVANELRIHSQTDYLRTEFILLMNKLSPTFPHYAKLRLLLDPTTSLDQVFKRLRVPVLLTYDSPTTQKHTQHNDAYLEAIREELADAHAKYLRQDIPVELMVNLILVPLATKNVLLEALDRKLKGIQA
jgi:hypothetical protein